MMTWQSITKHTKSWHFWLGVGIVVLGMISIYLCRGQIGQISSEVFKVYLAGSR